MTDNEIMQALLWYLTVAKSCGSVTLGKEEMVGLCDLINRLKAEIAKKDTEIGILIRKKEALRDEIAEQQAEIERLRHILVSFMSEVENWEHKHGIDTSNIPKIAVLGTEKENCIKQAKSEAYREFAERLKAQDGYDNHIFDDCASLLVPEEYRKGRDEKIKEIWGTIDNLVKELTESK